jgi:hypothetical protein
MLPDGQDPWSEGRLTAHKVDDHITEWVDESGLVRHRHDDRQLPGTSIIETLDKSAENIKNED